MGQALPHRFDEHLVLRCRPAGDAQRPIRIRHVLTSAVLDDDVVLHDESFGDSRTGWAWSWETTHHEVSLRSICCHSGDLVQPFVERIAVVANQSATPPERLAPARCLAQEGFRETVDVPDVQLGAQRVRKFLIGRQEIAQPQSADPEGLA